MKRGAFFAACAVTALLTSPVLAQDNTGVNVDKAGRGARGGVATLALAQELYAQGRAGKDALAVLTAARLAGSVGLREVAQKKTTEGPEAAGEQPGRDAPVDAAAMLAVARALAGEDEVLAGLIDQTEAEAAHGRAGGASYTPSRLSAGQVDLWQVPFYAAAYAELAVLGDGGANLDVVVTDENGNTVCMDLSWSDRVYCDFTPAWNGYFQVRVENAGDKPNSYYILTN